MRVRARALALALVLAAACETPPPPALERPTLRPELVQRGGLLFLDLRISGDGSRACATCHPGGGSDGLLYRDGEPVQPQSAGARKSPRLWGLWQTAPYLWDGSIPDMGGTLERMLRVEMRGGRLDETDRAALEAYLLSLPPFDRGRIDESGDVGEPSTLSQRRGREIFVRAECSKCHPAPAFTDRAISDVGSGTWDTPALRGISAEGSQPYGHDGRWTTLEQAVHAMPLAKDEPLSPVELDWLLEYLKLL
jgi:cytochrome c peroxidase